MTAVVLTGVTAAAAAAAAASAVVIRTVMYMDTGLLQESRGVPWGTKAGSVRKGTYSRSILT